MVGLLFGIALIFYYSDIICASLQNSKAAMRDIAKKANKQLVHHFIHIVSILKPPGLTDGLFAFIAPNNGRTLYGPPGRRFRQPRVSTLNPDNRHLGVSSHVE
jgi:hypothetical protein